jgi:hypothetical protein
MNEFEKSIFQTLIYIHKAHQLYANKDWDLNLFQKII